MKTIFTFVAILVCFSAYTAEEKSRKYYNSSRVPWNSDYMTWRNKQFSDYERYMSGKMNKNERETYRAWRRYRKSLKEGQTKKAQYRAWRRYYRRIDKINKRHNKYKSGNSSANDSNKSTDDKIVNLILDF